MRNLFIGMTFVVGITIAILLARYHASLYGDLQPPGTLVEIPRNINADHVARLLGEKGIVKNTRLFLKVLTRNNLDKKIRAGIYEFAGRPYIYDVIDALIKGKIAYIKLVFPEGITCHEIGKILEQEGICASAEFDDFAKKQGLEGFLFPDTYKFPYGVSKEAVVKKMIERFQDVVQSIKPDIINLSRDELVKIITIASIVEKEAEVDSERPVIAGIFYNRLKRNMPLQSCATIKYVIGNKKNLGLQDLKVQSPYNTYKHRGLPPSPICNPGRKSLEAAIYPSKTSYLFFVSKGDGRHYFSTTYSEHLSAKSFYISDGLSSETEKKQ
ncbi:MAG: endolytic transglycosylase MltG [Candidatus Omnitrophica bacterium]|nr:endolytic transglycosylase MltG [Candidatus Omnitrophota bacterium]MCM8827981.1 endolytic transglycosylase MltG [Candidatus Omnitrophota bacterium]